MRLIDADELIMTIDCSADLGGALGETVRSVKAYAIHMVESARTVDAVKVVRCKGCKYMTGHYDTDGNAPYWTCAEWDSGTDYDGFCHYAERRTDETD